MIRRGGHGWSALAASLALVVGSGCGGGGELTHAEYERLPRDARQEIFDAENDFVIARNRQDDAEEQKRGAQRARGELDQRWKRTSQRLQASNQAAKEGAVRRVFDAHVAYLDSQLQVANAEIRETQVATALSRARLELVRQRELARIGRATATSLKQLENRTTSFEAAARDAGTAAAAARTRASALLEAWKTAEDSFAQTADYDTVVWGE